MSGERVEIITFSVTIDDSKIKSKLVGTEEKGCTIVRHFRKTTLLQ